MAIQLHTIQWSRLAADEQQRLLRRPVFDQPGLAERVSATVSVGRSPSVPRNCRLGSIASSPRSTDGAATFMARPPMSDMEVVTLTPSSVVRSFCLFCASSHCRYVSSSYTGPMTAWWSGELNSSSPNSVHLTSRAIAASSRPRAW